MTTAYDLNVARLRFFLTIVLGLNLWFFRYLSKIDARTHLRVYFKHICVVLFIVVFRFSKKITFVPQKRTILGHIHHLTPLDQANSRRF